LITPAFVNGHTHLALGFLRGADMEDACRSNMVEEFFFAIETQMSTDDIRAFARMGAYESLLAGVGFVWDHYYAGDVVAEALAEVGLAGVVAPTLQDISGPGEAAWERQLEATVAIDDSDALRAAGVYAALGPHATDTVSESLWRRAQELAVTRDLPIHAHLAQSPEEFLRARARHGKSPVEWLHDIGALEVGRCTFAHAIFASRGDLARLDPTRHTLVFCPYSQLVFGFPARAALWTELGLSWIVGTDCASNNDSMNVQKELRLTAGLGTVGVAYTPAYELFLESGSSDAVERVWRVRTSWHDAAAATRKPARLLDRVWRTAGAMHPKIEVGAIRPGALANLLAWDLDHPSMWPSTDPLRTLAMADTIAAIDAMWVSGREIGDLRTSEAYREARIEADERLARLLG
jgi:cytosine/adenosine deaminase-related metal-dependent hydrolase